MLIFALSACTGSEAPPPRAVDSSATPTGHTGTSPSPTGHTGVTDTGWTPDNPLEVAVGRLEPCPDPYTYPVTSTLDASEAGPGAIQVAFAGVVGCSCTGRVHAWTEGETVGLLILAGDCDIVVCCELDATLSGVPAGTWTVEHVPSFATDTVTVP
jgi:hypothetical protein